MQTATSVSAATKRPVYRNISIHQIVGYRLPLAGWVSILHRVSGALLFLALPLVLWLFDKSSTSQFALNALLYFSAQWWFKLVLLVLIWAYLQHFCAGVRHVWMDVRHTVSKTQGAQSALAAVVVSLVLTVLAGLKLFGVY